VVLCITGNGLKTQEAVADHVGEAHAINASIDEFDALLQQAEPKTEPLVAA
jgi:threonine synthase